MNPPVEGFDEQMRLSVLAVHGRGRGVEEPRLDLDLAVVGTALNESQLIAQVNGAQSVLLLHHADESAADVQRLGARGGVDEVLDIVEQVETAVDVKVVGVEAAEEGIVDDVGVDE